MATAANIAKQAVQDKIESQVKTIQAKLDTLKAKAETAKANAELKAIADLLVKKATIDRKVNDLKKAGESTYQQAKADLESRVAELEKSVKAIEAKVKTA
jgi:outer membrane murein-binding lipoprotein Lpp